MTSDSVLSAGLIGCGFFAENHLQAWTRIEGVKLVSVCDREVEKAKRAADKFGVAKFYGDAAEMIESERLDFVDIITTMPTHRPLVELMARHRIPTIVQKPFAPSWEDCLAMVKVCREAGVPLMVHENFRFQIPMLAVQKVLRSGAIGDVKFGRISFRTSFDVYANQPYLAREEQFIILDLGTHLLDLARVFQGEVETVYCQALRVKPGIRGEDMATVILHHRNGGTGVVECSYASSLIPDAFPQTLVHLEGTRGSIRVLEGFQMVVVSDGRETTANVSPALQSWMAKPWNLVQESVLNTQQHWVDCLRRGIEPDTAGADYLKTYALVVAAYQSVGARTAVPPAL